MYVCVCMYVCILLTLSHRQKTYNLQNINAFILKQNIEYIRNYEKKTRSIVNAKPDLNKYYMFFYCYKVCRQPYRDITERMDRIGFTT